MKIAIRQSLKIILGITVVICVAVIITGIAIHRQHPVLYQWISGGALCVGKPIKVTVYTDNQPNNSINVYRDKRFRNDYLLALSKADRFGMLKYINLNLDEKWIGRPVSTNIDNYDVVNGSLYQSYVGAHFSDFRDNMKGYNFDPDLYHSGDTIRFNVPPGQLNFRQVMILLR